MPGRRVAHFEVVTNGNVEELQKFYAETFGWSINADNDLRYGVVTPEDAGIGGGIGARPLTQTCLDTSRSMCRSRIPRRR
jgi:predicted enzyme related to lactoylglutathione lyase